jgi:DNA-binding winged helix-turn-helix (wHTH) protein/tetratricopeptide (TPR) repeat protein
LGSKPDELPNSIHFGEDFKLDVRAYELRSGGVALKLKPIPMDLLLLLIERRGELVTREQIVERIWGKGIYLDTDNSINAAVSRIRQVLRDDAEQPRFVQTVTGKGYRFIAPVVEDGPRVPSAVENGLATASSLTSAHATTSAHPSGSRRRLFIAAGVSTLLVVAAFATWKVIFATPVLTASDVILLASFVNKTGDPIFDNSLDKAVEVKLTESPFLSVFPEADARRTMGTMRHDPSERVTQDLGIEICKRQGLKAVVVPEIVSFGSRYLITVEAIDARTEKTIARGEEEAQSKDKVIAALGRAASRLRKQLGESLRSLEKYDAPLDLATTSSLEALEAYRAGQTRFRSGKQGESIPFFEKAVELDPQFCSAYAILGSAYFSLGDDQSATKNFAKAFVLKDGRLTQEENFQTTALYHQYITGNLEKATAVLVLYQQIYPRSVFAANRLGIAYAGLGKTEDALKQFKWALAHSPVPSAQYYSNTTQALMTLGRFDEAKKLLDDWQQKGSLNPFQRQMRYRIALFENDSATMEKLKREGPTDDFSWLQLQMQLAFLSGDFSLLRTASEALVSRDSHAKEMENAANELALHGQLESFAGNYNLARRVCHQAKEMNKDSASELWRCAEALGYAGEVTQAEAMAVKLDRISPEDTLEQKVYLKLIRSVVERKRGNPLKAADLLTPSMQYQATLDLFYQRAQAYLAAGQPAKAAIDFNELLARRGWNWWQVYVPLSQLGLARAYAMQGDREKSRKAYGDFFTTWKDADEKIPLLRQAKAEYKELTATASTAVVPGNSP